MHFSMAVTGNFTKKAGKFCGHFSIVEKKQVFFTLLKVVSGPRLVTCYRTTITLLTATLASRKGRFRKKCWRLREGENKIRNF